MPKSRVLDGRKYIYNVKSDMKGVMGTIGYPYSFLE